MLLDSGAGGAAGAGADGARADSGTTGGAGIIGSHARIILQTPGAPRDGAAVPMTRLSVVIVAKNEAANIVDCVRSCGFADEVIVVDSGSSDGTPDLARAEGARVLVTPDWPGYGPQNNRGIDLATGDWFFSLDADERITPALAGEIRAAISDTACNGFRVPRSSMYCGRFIRHSGWTPDYTRRLARRGQGRFTEH